MPFGSDPFRDWSDPGIRVLPGDKFWSPLPFGSDPFRDSTPSNLLGGRSANLI